MLTKGVQRASLLTWHLGCVAGQKSGTANCPLRGKVHVRDASLHSFDAEAPVLATTSKSKRRSGELRRSTDFEHPIPEDH